MSLFADSSHFNENVSSIVPTRPFLNPVVVVDGYNSIGCYTEGTNGRALASGATTTTETVKSCLDACALGNYMYAGVEYGGG